MCVDKWTISSIITSFFVGQLLTVAWLPRVSDRYGRKLGVQVSAALSIVLFIVLLLTGNKFVLATVLLLFGMLFPLTTYVAQIYMLELTPRKYHD